MDAHGDERTAAADQAPPPPAAGACGKGCAAAAAAATAAPAAENPSSGWAAAPAACPAAGQAQYYVEEPQGMDAEQGEGDAAEQEQQQEAPEEIVMAPEQQEQQQQEQQPAAAGSGERLSEQQQQQVQAGMLTVESPFTSPAREAAADMAAAADAAGNRSEGSPEAPAPAGAAVATAPAGAAVATAPAGAAVATTAAAAGGGGGVLFTAHKRHLSAGPEDDPFKDRDHAAKRPAGGAAAAASSQDGTERSRSRSRSPLHSVFAQPHVQAGAIPASELPTAEIEAAVNAVAAATADEMLPPRQPAVPSGRAAAAAIDAPAVAADRRVAHSWSSGSLPPIEAIPSSASLQGWLVTGGSPLAGSPLKRLAEGSGSGSFRRWIRSENSCGSFTLPSAFGSSSHLPASVEVEDSLGMDIQLLPPVVPEEVPEEEAGPEAVAAAQQRQSERRRLWQLAQQQAAEAGAAAAGIAASERAFAAKIAGWEDELLGMLQAQMAPITIRAVVQQFKDRIETERDKSEFKALCDKYTVVVEYPVSSGTKCLALKAWLQPPEGVQV